MAETLSKIELETRIFGGVGRVIIFKNFTPELITSATTFKDIFASGGQDCGKVVNGSPSWDGDEATINTVTSTLGEVIRSFPTAGTFAWSCRIPHSVETAVVAGGRIHKLSESTDVASGGLQVAKDAEIVGINPEDMDFKCAIGILNLERQEISIFPRASVIFSPTSDDEDTRQYTISATADSCKTANLDTMMFIPLMVNPFEVTGEGD